MALKAKGAFKDPQALAAWCEGLRGLSYRESIARGAELGLRPQHVEMLRTLLGFSADPVRIPKEVKQAILAESREGANVPYLAEKYGLNVNFVYHFTKKRGLLNKIDDFWTERKIMQLCMLVKSGVKNCEAARIMGIKKNMFQSMKFRLLNRRDCARWLPIAEKAGLFQKQAG